MTTAPYPDGAGYVRGRYVPIAEATLPVTDWGFTRSDVVYDVVHVFKGGFFRLRDHLDRFERSMEKRRIHPPEDRAAIEAILHRCVALTGLANAYVAMVASRGRPRVMGSRRPADCENHLIAYALPWIDVVPKDVQARGAHVFIASTPRVPDASVDPTVKNYQWNDLTSGLMEAHDAGFDTAVLCDAQGFLTEGPGFNVFVVRDGRVSTPDRGSLRGITRQSVLDLCAELGIEAAVEPIPRSALDHADEVFLATTAGGVMPASRIGGRILGNDRPGPISTRLKDIYWRKHDEGWHHTPVRYQLAEAGE
ncbi:aminotransferase class IV [Bradyrhizobium sp. AUGA SZCCT0182]|uniref:aminotransferase class IV n=1 Tax=Bradyrhizobium sp. AUGA SZCCT0182 TaxID=2807667 RepID=UPI001BA47D7F|nr:aminotransferase class IV [Bradyrhizobium sp. AUGA SZCCT0182]MBR1234762.1 aminotransferase class IV [Bradyrhizobium sp. AUGA SZCCT0182]